MKTAIKNWIIRDIKNLFEQDEEHIYKSVRLGNFYGNNYVKYDIIDVRKKALLVKEYLDEIKSNLKDIINDLNKSDIWKIQSAIVTDYSSKDTDEKHVLNSKSDNIEIMIWKSRYTNADLKISLYVCVHIKRIPWKFRILNPQESRVICLWSL